MGNYIYPFPYAVVRGKVSQLFGQFPGGNNPRGGHTGIDFAVPEGTAVLAPCDGLIEFEGWVTGNYWENPWWFLASDMVVVVNAGPGLPSFTMGHLSATLVNHGQYVKKGQVIAYSGNTGISTGPHCHFEYLPDNWDYQNGTYGRLDPQLVCEYWDGSSSLEPQGDILKAPTLAATHWAIDISNFQGDINIASVNPDRVIIRASEGVGGSDAWLGASVRKTRNAGKAVDFYHFSHIGELDGNTPEAEADWFLSQIRQYWKPGDHVVLDWEARYSQLGNGAAAKAWMDRVLASLKAGPEAAVFYSNLTVLSTYNDGLKIYRDAYPQLWLAFYGDESLTAWGDPAPVYGTPRIPKGWALWGWQYTQYGRVPGYTGNLDLNIIYGDDTMASSEDILAALKTIDAKLSLIISGKDQSWPAGEGYLATQNQLKGIQSGLTALTSAVKAIPTTGGTTPSPAPAPVLADKYRIELVKEEES